MQAVFLQAVNQAREDSSWTVLRLLWRELHDFPTNLYHQYQEKTLERRGQMNLIPERNQPSSITSTKEIQTGTWKDAVLAGLPHFMMGLCMGSAKLLSQEIYQNSQFVSAVVIVILAFLVVMMLFTAYRGG